MFSKRTRDEKSTETDSSKSVMLLSPLTSPVKKKLKFNAPPAFFKSDSSTPLVVHGYTIDGNPETFSHLISDSLLPQSVEGHSSKSATEIIDHCAGHSFHVTIDSFIILFVDAPLLFLITRVLLLSCHRLFKVLLSFVSDIMMQRRN